MHWNHPEEIYKINLFIIIFISMATTRPFAFNSGSTITDMFQIGDLAIGPLTGSTHRYDFDYGSVKWYMGCDEGLGYVIAHPKPSTHKMGFMRSSGFTDQAFIDVANAVDRKTGGSGTFTNAYDAKQWVDAQEYWTTFTGGTEPPAIFFEKTDYGSEVDEITPNVWLTRGDSNNIYNTKQEIEANQDYKTISPRDVIWNSVYTDSVNYGFGDLSNIIERKYASMWEAADSGAFINIPGLELVAYLIPDDKYYTFSFSGWTSGQAGGGFSYTRQEIVTPTSLWTAFTKPNFGAISGYTDEISSGLHITRDNSKGIYNPVAEGSFDNSDYLSPLGSDWNSSYTDGALYGWGNLTNLGDRTYGTWTEANAQYPADPGFQDLEMILYDTGTTLYHQIQFRQWSQGQYGSPEADGGGFRYIRKQPIPPTPTPTPTPSITVSPTPGLSPTPTPTATSTPTPTPSLILTITPSSWSLPSTGEWEKIEDLYSYGVFISGQTYWTSTENDSTSVSGTSINGSGVTYQVYDKDESHLTRPFRTFTTNFVSPYNLYDVGPGGGRIFDIIGSGISSIYYEFAPNYLTEEEWSNITGTTVGTSAVFGSGTTNTDAIIAQSGHTNSSAQTCRWYGDNRLIIEITTSSPNESVTIPHADGYSYNYTVDYGDLSSTETVTSYNDPHTTHTYVSPGTYNIIIDGLCETLYVNGQVFHITNIPNWGNTGLKLLNLFGCSDLPSVPTDINGGFAQIETLNSVFRNCTSLTSIPSGLFDYVTGATGCISGFAYCTSLTSIPSGLFDSCTLLDRMDQAFQSCNSLTSIPSGLFDNNINITDVGTMFRDSALSSIPSGLFDSCTLIDDFSSCFYNTDITSIPSGLFDNCTAADNMSSMFDKCSSLSSIPNGLFDYNTGATSLNGTFQDCTSITSIPTGLLDSCTLLDSVVALFAGCSSLASIPSGLFDNNPLITSFVNVFKSTGIISIPSGLFVNNTAVISFLATFQSCSSLTGMTSGLFDNTTLVSNFQNTFSYCSSLTSIPANLFDNNDVVTSFYGTFFSCTSLTGASGQLWLNPSGAANYTLTGPLYNSGVPNGDNCYYNCTGLTDYASIPTYWK